MSASPASECPAVDASRSRRGAILAGSIGNLVEWYDFYVYAFTALYFSASFFPSGDRTAQLLGTSGIFAVGFLFRPLGGWFFGWYADRHGRSRSLVLSLALMGVGSVLIAAMPTYAAIGPAAPFLLLLPRILQGFSTGGQYGTVATYLCELAEPKRRGFYGSFQYVTLIGGQLLALAVVIVLQKSLSQPELSAWGWRVPFAIGAFAAALAICFRHLLHEPERSGTSHPDSGRLRGLLPHWRAMLMVFGLTAGGSLVFYAFSTYMQKYLVNTAGMATETVSWVMTAVLVPFALLQPLLGALSDRVGRRWNIVASGLLSTLTTVPLLTVLAGVTSAVHAFLLIFAALAINSLYTSVSGLYKAELFPSHVRALGVNISFGLSNAIFGGTAEYFALRFKSSGWEAGFYWYVTAVCLAAFVTSMFLPDLRSDQPLRD